MKIGLGNDKNKEPNNYFGTLQITCGYQPWYW